MKRGRDIVHITEGAFVETRDITNDGDGFSIGNGGVKAFRCSEMICDDIRSFSVFKWSNKRRFERPWIVESVFSTDRNCYRKVILETVAKEDILHGRRGSFMRLQEDNFIIR